MVQGWMDGVERVSVNGNNKVKEKKGLDRYGEIR